MNILYFFIDFLKFKKYDFIVAPYESDSQLYYLYKTKKIDYIMSEDSDIAAHGCLHVIKCYKKNGSCQVMNDKTIKNLKKSIEDTSSLTDLQKKNLTKMKKCLGFLESSDK